MTQLQISKVTGKCQEKIDKNYKLLHDTFHTFIFIYCVVIQLKHWLCVSIYVFHDISKFVDCDLPKFYTKFMINQQSTFICVI